MPKRPAPIDFSTLPSGTIVSMAPLPRYYPPTPPTPKAPKLAHGTDAPTTNAALTARAQDRLRYANAQALLRAEFPALFAADAPPDLVARKKAMAKILTAKTDESRNVLLVEMWKQDLPLGWCVEASPGGGEGGGGAVDGDVAIVAPLIEY